MRELDKNADLQCSAEEAFQLIFLESAGVAEYHKKQGHTKGLVVGEWNGSERKIIFTMPLNIPDTLKSVVGVDVISVTECQSYERFGDGKIVLTSLPLPEMTGAASFESIIKFTITPKEDNMCVINGHVECTCKGYWGLQSTIESQMIAASDAEMSSFMEFCQSYCQKRLLPMDGMDFSEEEFYEADETASQSSLSSLQHGSIQQAPKLNSGGRRQSVPADFAEGNSSVQQLKQIDQTLQSIVKLLEQGLSSQGRGMSSLFILLTFLSGTAFGVTIMLMLSRLRKTQ